MSYESSIPFRSHRVHAAAVYCSDGRFGEQCDDFLQRGLALPNYDRLAVPGGAAGLAADRDGSGLFSGLMFLVNALRYERNDRGPEIGRKTRFHLGHRGTFSSGP